MNPIWLIPVFLIGVLVGWFICVLMVASSRADSISEKILQEFEKNPHMDDPFKES